MRIRNTIALLAVFTGAISAVNAQWQSTASVVNLSEDIDGTSVDLSGVVASLGYQFEVQDKFKLIPNVRVGGGSDGDWIFDFDDIELDHLYGAGIKAQWESDKNGWYAFGHLSYAELKISIGQISDSSSELGIGAGVGYDFSEAVGFEVSFEDFDGTEALGFGLKFMF